MLFVCVHQFFQATDQPGLVGWAAGLVFCSVWVSVLKIWAWLEISRYTILREVKRLELQVARLNDQLESRGG